jgi:hypothetical protein
MTAIGQTLANTSAAGKLFRKTPFTMTIIYRSGFAKVNGCSQPGMFSIGGDLPIRAILYVKKAPADEEAAGRGTAVLLCGVSPLVWRRLLVVSTTSIAVDCGKIDFRFEARPCY